MTDFGPFLKFEGTSDLLLTGVPVVIITFQASGSITAGNGVTIVPDGTVRVATATGSTDVFGGVSLKSAASGDKVGIIVFGPLKNLLASGSVVAGTLLSLGNAGTFVTAANSSPVVARCYTNATDATFLGLIRGT